MSKNFRFMIIGPGVLGLIAAIMLLTASLARSAIASPSTFTVNNTSDLIDDNVVNTVCHAANGNCTLRAAIMQANALSNTTIILPAGVYTLTIIGSGEDNSLTGDLDIKSDLIISGANAATTIIQGGPGWNDRIFQIFGGTHVQINNVTVKNGAAGASLGGGLYINGAQLLLSGTQFISNSGVLGGGIYSVNAQMILTNNTFSFNRATAVGGGMAAQNGSITLTNIVFMTNTAPTAAGFYAANGVVNFIGGRFISNTATSDWGGGIFNGSASQLTLNRTQFIRNIAVKGGGGVVNYGRAVIDHAAMISNSTSISGYLGEGGAIRNSAVATVTYSTLQGNLVGGKGGAIYNDSFATLTVVSTVFAGNVTTIGFGGAIGNDGSSVISNSTIISNSSMNSVGGGLYNSDRMNIFNSAIVSNTAGLNGGGISNWGTLKIANSTISSNATRGEGGGVQAFINTVQLNNVTIADNVADSDHNGSGDGGGLFQFGSTAITMANTLIAHNLDFGGQAPNCSGTINSLGYNLILSPTGCIIAGTLTGVMTRTNPLLGPLQDNGGGTLTHALLKNSPAINAGNPTGCKDANGNLLSIDQRGFPRPVEARCDIGAFEVPLQVYLPLVLKSS